MSDWYSEAREADGRTDEEVMAEIRLRREAERIRMAAKLQSLERQEGDWGHLTPWSLADLLMAAGFRLPERRE